jgi:ribose transport system substrate-binding protein
MRRSDVVARVVLTIVGVAGAAAIAGCGRHSTSETYYLIGSNLKLPYWKTVDAGFKQAAADYHVTAQLEGPDNFDAAAERDAFHKAVIAHPAGILVSVVDTATMKPEIDAAVAQGIPVITVDSDAATSSRLFFIGTDNLAAGRLGGRRLAEALNGKGNVVFFSISGQPNMDDRLKGYLDVINEHPAMKVVDVFNMKGDATSAFDKAEEYLARTGAGKIDAFVCLDSASGKEVAEVLQRNKATDRPLIAMDVNPETLELIKSGAIDSTVSQKPYTMGYVGLKMLDEVHHNPPHPFRSNYDVDSFAPYPVFVNTGTSLVDKHNVDVFLQRAAEAGAK